MEPQPDIKVKRTLRQIMNSKVSVRSEDKTVKYLSILLILSAAELLFAFYSSVVCDYHIMKDVPQEQTTCTGSKPTDEAAGASAANMEDDASITAIKEYYALLESQKLEEAYAMRVVDGVSAEEFRGWYQDVEYARPENFKDAGEGVYDFTVAYKDKDAAEKTYGVRMAVSEGRLSTVSSTEFEAVSAEYGEYRAYSAVRGDKNYLVLAKGGEETILDVGDYSKQSINEAFNEEFADLKFSSKGNYILYDMRGYESTVGKAYGIKTGKTLRIPGVAVGDGFDITPDENYLYACLGIGMDSGIQGEVYAADSFKKVFDAGDQNLSYMNVECSYDEAENAVVFMQSEPNGEGNPTRVKKFKLGE